MEPTVEQVVHTIRQDGISGTGWTLGVGWDSELSTSAIRIPGGILLPASGMSLGLGFLFAVIQQAPREHLVYAKSSVRC